MRSLSKNVYNAYSEAGVDGMSGITKEEKWIKCVPASLRDQATILIRQNLYWRERC